MEMTLRLEWELSKGELVFVATEHCEQGPTLVSASGACRSFWPVGLRLQADGKELLRLAVNGWLPSSDSGQPAVAGAWAEALQDLEPCEGLRLTGVKKGLSLAWITLSDKASQGLRDDSAGPAVERLCRERLDLDWVQGYVLPDELGALKGLLTGLALVQGYDLIVTTGGTGLGPRDVTPEATLAVIDKRLPGFELAMTEASLAKTPHGAISRAVAGTLGESLILNLPGSPKAVEENLSAVLPALKHAVDKLKGDPTDCARALNI